MASSPHKIRFISIPGKEKIGGSPADARKIRLPGRVLWSRDDFRPAPRHGVSVLGFPAVGPLFGDLEVTLNGAGGPRCASRGQHFPDGGFKLQPTYTGWVEKGGS
ncbi:hypothetical protein KM043_011627 [Ampulex compressa]|nr:hypothetical protein KM043_011627 [Ampulex compressa]